MALWVLLWVGLCVGQNPMCHLCVGFKLFCGWAFFNFFLAWLSCGCRVTLSSSSQTKVPKSWYQRPSVSSSTVAEIELQIMRRLTKSRTEGDAVRTCSPPQGSPQGRVPDFVKCCIRLQCIVVRWVLKLIPTNTLFFLL